jgi:hypothetical protein
MMSSTDPYHGANETHELIKRASYIYIVRTRLIIYKNQLARVDFKRVDSELNHKWVIKSRTSYRVNQCISLLFYYSAMFKFSNFLLPTQIYVRSRI